MNEIKKYTTEDFARYHAGTMPAREMHALEKEALEDPFLEDALEGYSITSTPASDAAVLRERISDAVSAKKVFFLSPKKGWWRIAALLVIMAGAGYLFLTVNNKVSEHNNLAKNEKVNQVNPGADSVAGLPVSTDSAAAGKVHLDEGVAASATVKQFKLTIPSQDAGTWSNTQAQTNAGTTSAYSVTPQAQQSDFSASVAPSPVNVAPANESAVQYDLSQNSRKDFYTNAQSNQAVNDIARNNNALNSKGFINNNGGYNNVYKKDQNGISAAPVTSGEAKTNFGTVADDKGKFKLNTSDSLVFAKTTIGNKSNINVLKKPAAPGIAVQKALADSDAVAATALGIKREAKELGSATTTTGAEIINISPKKGADKNSEVVLRGRTSIPPSGQTPAEKAAFDKYIKENMQPVYNQAGGRMAGEVLLSFTVKKGRPKNIKIAMSLCPPCEAQAIQLLENGPDWSGKKKEEKTVIIKF
jgi:hypothetical protein